MTDVIRHRGPDSSGLVEEEFCRIGFRRLAIIDVAGGNQPVTNEAETVKIFLNGEIYNHLDIRRDLESRGHQFNSLSDAEILPHLYEEHGIEMVSRLNGMFAICVCDLERRQVFLVRDRLGIKPLFYAPTDFGVVFGSELKCVLASGYVPRKVNRGQLLTYLNSFHSSGSETLIEGVHKVLPGESLQFSLEEQRPRIHRAKYYSLRANPEEATSPADSGRLDSLLEEAVRLQLVADVPVGISLSGGLDSSLLAYYASRAGMSDVVLFTIHFEGTPDEELQCAREVAQSLRLEHVVMTSTTADFLQSALKMIWYNDEPVADPAFYSAMKVAEAASSHVKVLLSGTGADELFAGYGRYRLTLKKDVFAASPAWLRRLAIRLGGSRSVEMKLLDGYGSDRFGWHAACMANLTSEEIDFLTSHLASGEDANAYLKSAFESSKHCNALDQQLYCDSVTYLPDQLLPVLDRSTMCASIEGRVPYLDHRLAEEAFSIRPADKLGRPRSSKHLLRSLARGRLPDQVLSRSKLGFPNAVEQWFNGRLGELVPGILLRPGAFVRETFPVAWLERLLATRSTILQRWQLVYALLVLELWHMVFVQCDEPAPPETLLEDMLSKTAEYSE